MVPGSSLILLNGLGHLAHEECPAMVTDIVLRAARQSGLLPAKSG
jgi:pimeloyl-ACP methyl ester carboxylesterase